MKTVRQPLASVAELVRGVTFSKSDAKDEAKPGLLPVLRAGNIAADQLDLANDLVFLEPSFVSKSQLLRPNDIVMCMSSGSTTVLGKCGIFEDGWNGTFGAFLATVRPDEAKCSPRFLYHYFRTDEFRRWASSSSGIGIKNIRASDLQAYELPLPPLEEQKRVAAILDQADALRRLRARALNRLNALGQAIFHEMFGDPRTNPKGWQTATLASLGELERGISKHRPRNDPRLLGGTHPLIQTGDVSRAGDFILTHSATYSDFGLQQSRKWRKGTLCITIAANIADTAILGFDACFPDSVVGFDAGSEATNFFVHRWFATVKSHLEQIAPAVAQKNINLAILRELPVIQPPSNLIAEFYVRERGLAAQYDRASLAAEKLDHLFSALQGRAFTGTL